MGIGLSRRAKDADIPSQAGARVLNIFTALMNELSTLKPAEGLTLRAS